MEESSDVLIPAVWIYMEQTAKLESCCSEDERSGFERSVIERFYVLDDERSSEYLAGL